MIFLVLLLWSVNFGNGVVQVTSLITMNATMAVVIDKSFFASGADYQDSAEAMFDLIIETVKNETGVGGIAVHVFRDTNITLHHGYTVLLSLATCRRTWILYEVARKEELVHLAITDRDCPRIPQTVGITVPMVQPGDELPQIFLDLKMIDALSWNNINIFHDDAFDRDTVSRVIKAFSDKLPTKRYSTALRTLFTFKNADTEWIRRQNVKDSFESINGDQSSSCFLIIVKVAMIADVMETAKALQMVHPGSQWLYVITDSSKQNLTNMTSLAELLSEGGNVAFIYNATGFDGSCNVSPLCHVKEIVKALVAALKYLLASEMALYESVKKREVDFVRLTKLQRRTEILKIMNSLLSGYKYAADGNCGRCLLWRFSSAITWGNFFVRGHSIAHMENSGLWTSTGGVNLTDVLFPHVAYGFRGISLPIATYHNPPWQIITVNDKGKVEYSGLTFDVIKYLAKKLNFTYSVIMVSGNGTGYWNRSVASKIDETEDRMLTSTMRKIPQEVITMVRNNKVLMAACAYTVNEFGRGSINFTIPIYVQTYSFLVGRPKQLSRVLLFASPFTNQTWACLGVAIITMGPILYMVHKYSPRSMRTSGLNSSWQCVWYVYGALLQQGGMYLPRSDSARILVGTWWLIVMVVVATYSGSLVAFLTFPKMDASILTVDDLLARRDKLTWSFPNGSFLEEHLQQADDEKYQILLMHAERHNESQEEEIIKRVKEGKHAFIDWRSSLRFLMRKDLLGNGGCHFSLSTDEFMEEPIALIASQKSPYLPIINSQLDHMHESGLMNKWISEQIPAKDRCWQVAGNDPMVNKRKVNVADMQGIFFVLFIGDCAKDTATSEATLTGLSKICLLIMCKLLVLAVRLPETMSKKK